MNINEVIGSIDGLDISGKTVIIKEEFVSQEFHADRRFMALHGFGCKPYLRGNGVYGYLLNPHLEGRAERFEIEGLAKYEASDISYQRTKASNSPETGKED